MIPDILQSPLNHIVEAAGSTIRTVVNSITSNPAPSGYTYNADWAARFPALGDVEIVSATHEDDYLKASPEDPVHWPYVGFFIDEVLTSPQGTGDAHTESYIGSLVSAIGVQGENWAMSQVEMFEIHSAIRSVLLSDQSLGRIKNERTVPFEVGGVIDGIRYLGFNEPIMDKAELRVPFLAVNFNYQIYFSEATLR